MATEGKGVPKCSTEVSEKPVRDPKLLVVGFGLQRSETPSQFVGSELSLIYGEIARLRRSLVCLPRPTPTRTLDCAARARRKRKGSSNSPCCCCCQSYAAPCCC